MSSNEHHGSAVLHAVIGEAKTMADTSLAKYFRAAVQLQASDLIMRGGESPKVRVRGALGRLDTVPPSIAEFNACVKESMSEHHWSEMLKYGSADMAVDFDVDGEKHRFRINSFMTRGRCAVAARRVSNKILSAAQLLLPEGVEKMCELRQGLVLLCGITGSGKSTTIAALIQKINETRQCHILTLEDPIEYLFKDAKAMVNQREIGIDVPNFSVALRAMVRENPDVVLVGEMRDRETFEAALQAAETGHLVFGTIHASSCSQAFARIYDLFPAVERDSIRSLLAYQIQGIVYQKLLPTIREDIPRVPAVEILLQGAATRRCIIEGREGDLEKVIYENRAAGMQSYTDSLVWLVENNYVHPRVAIANAPSPEELRMRLRGIQTK